MAQICDFGLARGVKDDVDLTKYVVTRWYRAPELLCSCVDYDEKIDVWSVGCILAELLGRNPLWPGEDYIKQMDLIFSSIGTPSGEDVEWISNEKAYQYIKRLKPKPKIPWKQKFPHANPLGDYSRRTCRIHLSVNTKNCSTEYFPTNKYRTYVPNVLVHLTLPQRWTCWMPCCNLIPTKESAWYVNP